MVETNDKLSKLRALMEKSNVSAYVCFHMDAHNSEYIAPCDERIAYISGFKGSAGVCVVTPTDAKMWTDSRYFLAGAEQLESGWTLEKQLPDNKTWFEWIADKIKDSENPVVGWDYTQYPHTAFELRKKYFKEEGVKIMCTENLVDQVWGEDRPVRP